MILTHGANSLDRLAEIGGRKYRTVKIGNQVWLAENLDFKFAGCNIGGTGNPSTPNAWYYGNNEETYGIDGVRKCGLLYNWFAVKLLNDNRSGLIPGWHVPTKDEWTALADAVGGASTAGTKLKAANVSWAPSWKGTNNYGLWILPAGYRFNTFFEVGNIARLWTITEIDDSYAVRIGFDSDSNSIATANYNKAFAISLRLVKDTP